MAFLGGSIRSAFTSEQSETYNPGSVYRKVMLADPWRIPLTLFRRFGFLIILLLLSLAGVTGASLESPIQLGERCLICQSCGHQVKKCRESAG